MVVLFDPEKEVVITQELGIYKAHLIYLGFQK